jgi:hypothetical protein
MDARLKMKELVRHIKFPFHFDVKQLQSDIETISNNKWIAHYNKNDYEGNWTSLSLFSVDGKSETIYASPTISETIFETEILSSCAYLKEVLDHFLFKKTCVRLLRLAANAEVKPHSDNCLGYEDGTFRLHIPIITNPDVEFILDNQRLVMNEGECWYINANFIHSVANKGKEDRIHLVIDGIRNDWSDALFFKEHDESQFQKPIPEIKEEEKLKIIAELKRLNSDVANELISKLSQ